MPTLSLCNECGAEIPVGTPQGLCTRCLFALGLPQETRSQPRDVAEPSAAAADRRPAAAESVLPFSELPRIGDYELLEEIARGGMGVVYRAYQTSLSRAVAVKVILAGEFATREAVLRFRGDAEKAARLKHPNIIAIHGTGEHEGKPYFSMDYVPGGTLAGLVRDRPLAPRQAAELVRTLAEAIHYAHDQGILHRDLKPSNVLLDEAGRPVIVDFGLARRVDTDSFLTVTGQVMGSPSFMPPEQAGTKVRAGRHSDVYSLGGILFYLITGRPPFLGETVVQTLEQVRGAEPLSPRLLNPAVPPDLATVCLKCLEKDPARRYATAQDLAGDLTRFLADEPIRARPVGRPEKVWRWCRRRPGLASALAAAAVLLLVVAIGSPIAAFNIRRENQRAEQAVGQLSENLYAADIHLASQAVRGHSIPRALELLQGIEASPLQRSFRGWEWRHLVDRCRSQATCVLRGHAAFIAAIEFSPDDRLLASISEDGVVKLWDWAGRREAASWLAHPPGARPDLRPWTPGHSLAFSPDGRRLATGGPDGRVRFWDVETQRPEAVLSCGTGGVTELEFSPDGRWLAGGTAGSMIHLWAVSGSEPELLKAWPSETVWITALMFLPETSELVIAGSRSLARWSVSDPRQPTLIQREVGGADTLARSPDGQWLVSNTEQGLNLRAWRLPEFTPAREFPPGVSPSFDLAFSADGGLLASAGSDGTVTLLDFVAGSERAVLHGHEQPLTSLAFSHHGRQLASAGGDMTVRLWDGDSAARPPVDLRHGTKVQSIRFLPDSKHFITAGPDKDLTPPVTLVKLWDLAAGTVRTTTATSGLPIHNRLALAPDARLLAVNESRVPWGGMEPDQLRLLEVPSLGLVTNLPGEHPAFGVPQSVLVYSQGTKLLRRASLTGSPVEIGQTAGPIQVLAVSPDGRTAVTRSGHGTGALDFWDVAAIRPSVTRVGHEGDVQDLAFSPDGRFLASAAWDRSVGLWEVASRRLLKRLRGHRGAVHCVAFSADSRTLASGSEDGEVIFWDLRTRRELVVWPALPDGVTALDFSPDGRWLAIGGHNGTLRLWHAPSLEELGQSLLAR